MSARERVEALTAELAQIKADDVLVNDFHSEVLEKMEGEIEALTAEVARLTAELTEWRGYASVLAVHGMTPPKGGE